jgi:mitochondrial distribution and morphology protein 34
MSFKFNWNSFNEDNFYSRAKTLLTNALNKSNRPHIIVDKIVVKDLWLGEAPPDLEILEIGDLADDRFRGIFKLNYTGDASITLETKVQANMLNVYSQNSPNFSLPTFVGAASSLAMPLNLTLSEIKLSGIIILVFSKAKGLTLVFRNDPLESIKVTSTFDALPGIARFLQVQIENQIRILFREELPSILHKLSLKWTPSPDLKSPEYSSPTSPKVKPVTLMEIDPDLPELSPSNMLRLEALIASQQTLNLFTPNIPQAVYRSNLELHERQKNKSKLDVASISKGEDLEGIVKIQSRNYSRSTHKRPRRRVVKIRRHNDPFEDSVSETVSVYSEGTESVLSQEPVVENNTNGQYMFAVPLKKLSNTSDGEAGSQSVKEHSPLQQVTDNHNIEPNEKGDDSAKNENTSHGSSASHHLDSPWSGKTITSDNLFRDFFSANHQLISDEKPPPYVA